MKKKPLLLVIIIISLMVGGVVLAVTYAGLGPISQPFILLKGDDVCKEKGTYCHVIRIDNGTANISFPSVINGTFNYTITGG